MLQKYTYNVNSYTLSLLLHFEIEMSETRRHNLVFSRYAFLSEYLTDFYTREEQKKKIIKNCPQWVLKTWPLDQANALPTELRQHSVARLNLHGLSCSIDSRNDQSPKCEVVHDTNLLPNTYQASTVSRALEWWSRDPQFNAHWAQFLVEFILLFPVNFWQTCQIFLSWNPQIVCLNWFHINIWDSASTASPRITGLPNAVHGDWIDQVQPNKRFWRPQTLSKWGPPHLTRIF